MNLDKKNNDKIDQLLQEKQDGMYKYSRSSKDLLDMGIKIGSQETGDIILPESFAAHLDKFNRSNLEFEWLVNFKDGRPTLHQFGPGPTEEHHFGEIDQSQLKSISFVSNFNWPTDNLEKRVIVTLDWSTGLFSFMNGFIPQDELGKIIEPVSEAKKLILVIKRRQSAVTGGVSEDIREFHGPVDEIFYYNRFLLGFETASGVKRALLIQPNGTINLWNAS